MPLIEPFQAEEWRSEQPLQQMEFEMDQDPFLLPDNHPAAKLQITASAVKDWILSYRVSLLEKGVRLAKRWKEMVYPPYSPESKTIRRWHQNC